MTSLWLDKAKPFTDDPLSGDESYDDVVVGAGLTGLTAALLLARAGRRVGLIEARQPGILATGNTTGKVSLLQGTRLSRVLSRHSEKVGHAYVEANLEGQQWLFRYCEDHSIAFQRRPAVTYASNASETTAVREEFEACRKLGLGATWSEELELPFPTFGAVVLDDQAQFDPMDVLTVLAEDVRAHGGVIHLGHRVTNVHTSDHCAIELNDDRSVTAKNVVLATGTPVLDRGLYFAKVEARRSYVLAFEASSIPLGMYLSAGDPARSLRSAPRPDGSELLIVGGGGHVAGRTSSELAHVAELVSWTEQHFPGAVETHRWSAQDYRTHDGIPFVGKLPRGGGQIFVATGYDKWGMTNAIAAALNIAAQILGERPQWAHILGSRITSPAVALEDARSNTEVGVALARGWVGAELSPQRSRDPVDGGGIVGRSGLLPTAESTIDGRTCAVSAICTHLGGIVKWNDAEQTWDCPLHGSRFSPAGDVLGGPATTPLPPRPFTSTKRADDG
ncbi:MAG: FAD-dependent oxidoreductase [Actinomycetota bacterium]|nr:FAD-dependent oxidoreductase [Actinomycetota bacterium]